MTKKLTKVELAKRKRTREREREHGPAAQARRLRNEYTNGLVAAALRQRSSGRFPDPPYPPPKRVSRPPRPEGSAPWPPDDVRWTPSVLNQFHPDYDWAAALQYHAIVGGWAGRSIVEVLVSEGFDRTVFGRHPTAFDDARVALDALVAWCRTVSIPPIFEAFSPANAERFIQDSIKRDKAALKTLANRRGIYAALWDAQSDRTMAYAESLKGPCELIVNPWRQPEVAPATVAKRLKARKKRPATRPRVVRQASLDALAEGRKLIRHRTVEHDARIKLKIRHLKSLGIVSNTSLANELNGREARGQRDGLQDATSIRRHLKRVAKWRH